AIAVFKDNKNIGYIPKNINVQIANCLEKKHRVFVGDIIYNYGFIDVLLYFYISEEKNNPNIYLDKNTILDLQSRKIDSKYLKPKSDAVKKNLFYRKKIVITGEFSFFPDRNELAELLFDSGADIDVGISKNIDYVIVGKSPGWKKIEKINELGIKTFNEEEIKNIFSL
ncbi:MAG TPA: hypothetical protein DIW37_11160, partial [Chryseobacterium sp.]|nr:hypothetical protein [Chryseobacterium sp.]